MKNSYRKRQKTGCVKESQNSKRNLNCSIKGKRNKREIWCIDSETDPFKPGRFPKPFIWGAYNGCEYHEFDKTNDLVDFLSNRHCLVYAHNGGKFDYHFFIEKIPSDEPIMVINGRLAKFRIGRAEFRDSWNIFPAALAAGGKKFQIDYSILERENREKPKNRLLIKERLRTDCVYLYEIVTAFIEEFGLHLTQAGASIHAWSKLTGIPKPRTTRQFYETIAPYYYGGRVECFATGEINHDFKIIDINSAYPFAMLSRHPWGESLNIGNTLPRNKGAIQRCFITLSCISNGALPFRSENGSLCFPNDGEARIYNITGWEYLAAKNAGAVRCVRILEVIQLPLSIDFKRYVDHFYEMKTNAQRGTPRYEFAKKFLNSLYGKYGANPANYHEYKIVPLSHIDIIEQTEGYLFSNQLQDRALVARPLTEDKAHYLNVAVAASITGFVRAYLFNALRKVKNPLYCDTDCIWCEDTADLELHPTNLGAWDLEASCNYGAIAGKKLYTAKTDKGKWKTACKGVKLTPEEIVKVARGENVKYIADAPQFSIKGGVRFIDRKIRKSA